jgi:hypothetical protein
MSRAGKLIAQLTCAAAILVNVALLIPQGISGESRGTPRVPETKSVYHFGTDAIIESPIDGNVQVMGGQAVIRSAVHGSVYVFGGNATVAKGGSVSGDVTCIGGKFSGDATRVGGHLYAAGSISDTMEVLSQAAGPTGGYSFSLLAVAVKLSLLCVWLLATIILVLISNREIRASSGEVRLSPFHSFALGLVAYTSFVLTAVAFSYLIPYMIGIPLLAGLAVFAVLTKIYGMIAVFHAVGVIVAGARSRADLDRRRWLRGDMAMALLGLLLLGAIRMIPVLGAVVWMTASLLGIGVALGTKFGRREPWFLVWRPVES